MRINIIGVDSCPKQDHGGLNFWIRCLVKCFPKDWEYKISVMNPLPDLEGYDLVYYMFYQRVNLSRLSKRLPTIAFFTHQEVRIDGLAQRFMNSAHQADYIVNMTKRYENVMVENGVSRDKCIVIPFGYDEEIFKPLIKVGINASLRERTRRKGEDWLEDFFNTTDKKILACMEFHVIGQGWETIVEKYKDTINIVSYGFGAQRDNVIKFFHAINYLLICSDYEGGPIPLVEALACGVPVVSRDVGNVNHEILADNDLLTVIDTPGDFVSFMDDKINRGRRRVEHLTWTNFSLRNIELIKKAVREFKF